MTRPPSESLVIFIFTSPDIKAESSSISNVSPLSWVEANQDVGFFLVWSDDSRSTFSECKPQLVSNNMSLLQRRSDCLGS